MKGAVMALANVRMACRAGSGTTDGGRCRHMVTGAGNCAQHQGNPVARAPDVVLFKCRLNGNATRYLERIGVPWQQRDDRRLDAQHRQHAEGVGRSAVAYRQKPDSGVPVFDRDGAGSVTVDTLWSELERSGYAPVAAHLYQKDGDRHGMAQLSVTFACEGDRLDSTVATACLEKLTVACWEHAHIWANPPQDDGHVVHTVNLAHRQPDATPKYRVAFDNGNWGLIEL